MTVTLNPLEPDRCVVRNTAAGKGRTLSVAPGRTPARHLHYGRVILAASDAPLSFETGERETGFICLKGAATVAAGGEEHALVPYDALYVPRDSKVRVTPGPSGVDLAEIAAPVEGRHPVQMVRYADVQRDPELHFRTGGPGSERDLNILLGKNVKAGRIVAGVTFSLPGNWTSWPPHEHAQMLEEAYLYIDMPAPSWGIQLVYNDPARPEVMTVVREGDIVLMPQGYHPNVAAPGARINFIWMMAAIREGADRQFGVVNVQPEYAAGGSGLEAAKGGR
jgi:5-deoxy-glucuronate isomerase